MLKITIAINEFNLWQGAEDTFNRIVEAEKLDELEMLLEDTYPNGLSDTTLNDILWFESEWVYEALDMEVEEEE